jgi:hypothetical protein
MFDAHGIRVSDKTVGKLLHQLGYSLQAAKKTVEGKQHPDRNAQFEHIAAQANRCVEGGAPFISVDTKKKELVGNFKNAGVEWQPKDVPELVDVHDFPSDALGKAIPYGIYNVADNSGFVNVGTDHDTPVFAVTSIEAWWKRMGSKRYPDATEIFITADAGGSNGYRARLEVRVAAPRRQAPPADPRQPFPAGNEQVEQGRAPPVLVHHDELARQAAPHLRDRGESDRQHHEQRWPRRERDDRSSSVPDREEGHAEADARAQDRTTRFSRRLELHDSPATDRDVINHVVHSRALRASRHTTARTMLPP